MGKKSTETVKTSLDPGAQDFRNYVQSQARNLAGTPFEGYTGQRVAGLDPRTTAGYQSLMQGNQGSNAALQGMVGNLGFTGGPLNVNEFMNPYMDEVIGGVRGDFNRMRESSLNAVGGDATSQGAFGGSRHGIAEGTALGEIARAEGSTIGGLRQSGYQSAVQNAMANRGQMGMMGLSAAQMLNQFQTQQGMAGIGLGQAQQGVNQGNMDARFQEFMRRVNQPGQNLGALQGIMGASPYGTTTETTSEGNWMNTLAGLGATGASFFGGPAGAAVGGLMNSGGSGQPNFQYRAPTNAFGPTPNFGFGG